MMKKILLGTDIFDKLIENDGYYVDKTELLYELVEETTNEVTLFTRPRRFGKSLTISMMESFFDIQRAESNVFDGLSIQENHPDFCAKWMHQFPVLLISMKDVEGRNFELAYDMLKSAIADLCKKHAVLADNPKVDPFDQAIFQKLRGQTGTEAEIRTSLKTIMRMMYSVYGKPIILLIDEYDVPLAKSNENHYYHKMLDVIRGIMSTSLKSNEYLKFAVVTGCLRIPKESIFTGVNNFASYSVLDEDFSEYFGFTQTEIEALLKYYDREDKIDLIRSWYDGYIFGGTEIYCPWDAMSFVSDLRKRKNAMPKSYWENTSGNSAIKAFFELDNDDVTNRFEALLNGKTITENVTNSLTYDEAYTSINNLWSILLMTGYVTAVNQNTNEDESVELRIPNREISNIFQKAVVDHFKKTVDQSRVNALIEALWDGDEKQASEIMSNLLFNTISFMDYHEDYYHAFMAGIFTGKGYVPKSNREQGLGRSDVDLSDRQNRRKIIIETKKSTSEEGMDFWCDEAIKQIVERQYYKDAEGFTTVLCYGISFFQKSAKVKLMRPEDIQKYSEK